MKTLARVAGLALVFFAAGPASALEVLTSAAPAQTHPDLAPLPTYAVAQHALLPELPEPDVLAMMLLGLVLIGYRASRDSNEPFESP